MDVNEHANKGGDTAPGTREEIAARNAAADKVAEAQAKQAKALAEARERGDDEVGRAVDAYNKAVPRPDVVGAPDAKTSSSAKKD